MSDPTAPKPRRKWMSDRFKAYLDLVLGVTAVVFVALTVVRIFENPAALVRYLFAYFGLMYASFGFYRFFEYRKKLRAED